MRGNFRKNTNDLIDIAEHTKKMINVSLINLKSANADIQDRIDEIMVNVERQTNEVNELNQSKISSEKLIREVSRLLGV